MIRPRSALMALAVAAALALAACGGGGQESADTSAAPGVSGENQPSGEGGESGGEDQPPIDQQTMTMPGGFEMGPLDQAQAEELVAGLGLADVQGQQISKDGQQLVAAVVAPLPAGSEANPNAIKDLLTKLSGGTAPEESTIEGTPVLVVKGSNGKTYMAGSGPEAGGTFNVVIGPDRETIERTVQELMSASQQQATEGGAPVTPPQ